MTPLIVIPAAGLSSRMRGQDKLLERVNGEALLRRQTKTAVATGCPVMVCLPPEAEDRQKVIADLPVTQILVPDAAEGIGATLRTAALFAARHAPERPMMILLPDVPGIETEDILTVINAYQDQDADAPVRATDTSGRPGTPLVIPNRLLAEFAKLTGDSGGKSILRPEVVTLVPISGTRATRDLDTPEDWAAWRAEMNPKD